VQVDDQIAQTLEEGLDATGSEWIPALRAAAVLAVDKIAAAAPDTLTAREVEAHLRAAFPEENLKARLVVTGTVFV